MITNDRQYKIAKAQIQEFKHSLEEYNFAIIPEDIHPLIFEAQKQAVNAQLIDLIEEVQEYELLKSGKTVIAEVSNLESLPVILIKARIANGLTQSDLAKLLNVKEQQIQRYESELYGSASLKTLIGIAGKLNIKLSGEAQLKQIDIKLQVQELNPNNYPFKEMLKRGWFGKFYDLNEAISTSAELLYNHFSKAGVENLQSGLTKKSIRIGSTFNQFALDAWYAQVIIKAKEQPTNTEFNKSVITDEWLKNLATLSKDQQGPAKAAEYLKNSGIRFVIEPSLEGTFLDGAAILIDNKIPVIALTLRHDRLDNFWFVVFHEIAHIYMHLNNETDAIFDDLDTDVDGIEKEADDFALNALIPNEIWRKSLVRFNPTNASIINQANKLSIHPALVAGRIRKETKKYYQFGDLIGQGEVRNNFILNN